MKNYKVITILKTFSKKDIYNFAEFLNSPYFNTEKPKKKLYKTLIKYHPDFDDPKLTNEKLFAAVFGKNEPYKPKKLRDKMSDLTLTLQEFLVIERIINKKTDIKRQLKLAFEERGLVKLFKKQFKDIQNDFDAIQNKNIGDYSQIFLNYLDLYYSQMELQKRTFISYVDFLDVARENLDKFYHLGSMQFGLEMMSRKKFKKEDFEVNIQPILDAVHKKDYKEEIFKLFVILLELYRSAGDEINYKKAHNYFFANWQKFKEKDQITMLAYLTNYVVLSVNQGKISFYQYSFEIHKFGIETGLLFNNNTISPVLFFNIVTFGCIAGEFDWTKSFIANYIRYVEEKYREETEDICKGVFYSEKGDYRKALLYLNRNFTALHFPFAARNILLKEYFKLAIDDDYYREQFANFVKNFRQYVVRNERALHPKKFLLYLELIKIFKRANRLLQKNASEEMWIDFLHTKELSAKAITKKWFQDTLIENNLISG